MEPNFPSNSQQRRRPVVENSAPKEAEKKVERVTSGSVIQRKKPWYKRLSENFFGGDAKGVSEYVLLDVALPAAKNTIADMVSQGIERTLFGEVRSTSRSGYRPGGHTAYNRMSRPSYARDEPRQNLSRRARATHNFDEIILGTRREADDVIEGLDHLIERYGTATVADLYDLVGAERQYTDTKFGWTDIASAKIVRVTQGYLLDLPRTEEL